MRAASPKTKGACRGTRNFYFDQICLLLCVPNCATHLVCPRGHLHPFLLARAQCSAWSLCPELYLLAPTMDRVWDLLSPPNPSADQVSDPQTRVEVNPNPGNQDGPGISGHPDIVPFNPDSVSTSQVAPESGAQSSSPHRSPPAPMRTSSARLAC